MYYYSLVSIYLNTDWNKVWPNTFNMNKDFDSSENYSEFYKTSSSEVAQAEL